jgi:hypothetical protein
VRLFKAVECYRQETGRPVAAIAGSDQAAWNLLNRLHQSQTQRFSLENGHLGEFKANRMHYMIDVLVGRLDYPSAAERSAYRLMREVGLHLTPGALSLKRNDAFFTFSQGNALMIVVSSMDAPALRMTVGNRFELATFPIPLPTRDNPDYGAHIIGTLSESEFPPGGTFILIRQSDAVQAGRALDFLRYATSVPSARLFSETTGMPSAVVGIVPLAEVRPFTPNSAGYPPGMNLDPSAETRRVVETSLHLLLNPVGGVDPFVEALAANLRPRFRRDAADRRGQDQVLQIQDGLQAAAYFGATGQDSDADARLEELVDVNLWYEWEALAIQARLDVYDASVGD